MKIIRVVVVDDQQAVRRGLSMLLGLQPDIILAGEAADGEEAIEIISILLPDVAVVDYELPDQDGLAVVRRLRDAGLWTPIVILTIHDQQSIRRQASEAGVAAFITKQESLDRLLEAIRRAALEKPEEDTS